MGCFPLLHCTPLMHIYVLSKNMVPDKEDNYSVNMGRRIGGAESWDQGEYVKSRLKVKTQEAKEDRVLPGASDKLKTFFQSPLGPESERPACHQSHSIRCQGHVPKIQSRQKTPSLTHFLHCEDSQCLPNPTCIPAAHFTTDRLPGLQKVAIPHHRASTSPQYSAPE